MVGVPRKRPPVNSGLAMQIRPRGVYVNVAWGINPLTNCYTELCCSFMMAPVNVVAVFCSILYADIVNFTTMASDCTAPVLVRMLNELVGKFEQLAQVSSLRSLTYLLAFVSAITVTVRGEKVHGLTEM